LGLYGDNQSVPDICPHLKLCPHSKILKPHLKLSGLVTTAYTAELNRPFSGIAR